MGRGEWPSPDKITDMTGRQASPLFDSSIDSSLRVVRYPSAAVAFDKRVSWSVSHALQLFPRSSIWLSM